MADSRAAAKLYTVEVGQHRGIEEIKSLVKTRDKHGEPIVAHDEETGYALFLGKTTSNGHWQKQRKARYTTRPSDRGNANVHRAFYVHRKPYVALHGVDVTQTGSHLCGRAHCFNPYHIIDESQHDNNSR